MQISSTARHAWRLSAHLTFGAFAAGMLAACGGGSSPASPSPPGGGGGTPPVQTTTITLAGNAADPRNIQISVGQRVTFVNNDTRSHDMASGPHPQHTECPELNVGPIAVGRSAETAPFTVARVCSFHDHDQAGVANLQGTITIR